MRHAQISPIKDYIKHFFCKEDPIQASIRQSAPNEIKNIQIDADEGQILWVLGSLINAKKIIEIGSLVGYSASWLLRVLPDDGRLYLFEKNPTHGKKLADNLRQFTNYHNATIILGDALQALPTIEEQGPFDLVFIDANKAAYPLYLDWCEKYVRKNGLIIGDNTLLFNQVHHQSCPENTNEKQWRAMRSFNERLAESCHYRSFLLPTHEGLTIAQKMF